MACRANPGSYAKRASSPFDRGLSRRATHLRVALPFRYSPGSTIATERHRSRTCLASGYDAVLVLKVCQLRCSWLREGRFGVAPVRLDPVKSGETGTKFSTEFSEQGW